MKLYGMAAKLHDYKDIMIIAAKEGLEIVKSAYGELLPLDKDPDPGNIGPIGTALQYRLDQFVCTDILNHPELLDLEPDKHDELSPYHYKSLSTSLEIMLDSNAADVDLYDFDDETWKRIGELLELLEQLEV